MIRFQYFMLFGMINSSQCLLIRRDHPSLLLTKFRGRTCTHNPLLFSWKKESSMMASKISVSDQEILGKEGNPLLIDLLPNSLRETNNNSSESALLKTITSGDAVVEAITPEEEKEEEEGEASVLSIEEQSALMIGMNLVDLLIARLTPTLVSLCKEANVNFFVINSVDAPCWLKSPSGMESLKPTAAASSWLGLQQPAGGGGSDDHCHPMYLSGAPIWPLRYFYTLWEFSQCTRIDNVEDTAKEYLYRLSKGDFFNPYFAILADSHGFHIISAKNGVAHGHHQQQQVYGWAAPGSRNALLDVLKRKSCGQMLLEGLCDQLDVRLTGFLGSGAVGRVFAVQSKNTTDNNNNNNNATYALKTVLTSTNSCESYSVLKRASSEFEFLSASANIPQIMPVVPGSYRQLDGIGFRGVGYLMAVVGEPILLRQETAVSPDTLLKVLSSLHAVHLTGRYHGDAHVNNAVMVSGEVVWIDACWGAVECVGENGNQKKRQDMEKLIESIFGAEVVKTTATAYLLECYANNLDSVTELHSLLCGMPQRICKK